MDLRTLVNDYVTFFVTMDPIGIVPLFLAMTGHLSPSDRRTTAIRGVFIAGIVLLSFALFGRLLLEATGVTIPSFRIAGGIILFLVGVNMLFHEDASPNKAGSKESGHDLAVFPLALPYIAGPGTMLASIVITRSKELDAMQLAVKILVMILALITTGAVLVHASKVQKYLGRTGCNVIERVMGILLAAMAAESVITGIFEAMGKTLAPS